MWIGANDYLANGLGYGLGLGIAFILYRNFAFRSTLANPFIQVQKFGVAVAFAYLANIAMIFAINRFGDWNRALTQLTGMATYSLVLYGTMRLWVFFHSPDDADRTRASETAM